MTTTPAPTGATARHVRVGIVGAGFAGLAMAIHLKQEGIEDYVVWERDADAAAPGGRTRTRAASATHIRLNCAVTQATWDEDEHVWRVATERGDYTAEALVAAPGPPSEPSIPDLPGLDTFAGTVFHTAAWNHDHDLTGRRVAVIGTGASAMQVVPEIQPVVEHVTCSSAPPPWVVPHGDGRRFPAVQRAIRTGVYLGRPGARAR